MRMRNDLILLAPDDQCRRSLARSEPGNGLVLLGLAREQ
jgi:hypothetical protein